MNGANTFSRRSIRLGAAALAVGCLMGGLQAMGQTAAGKVDFGQQIRPILAKKCFSCHGPDKHEAGLRLDTHKSVLSELDSGQHAVVPGKPQESELLARITSTEEATRMPPEGKPLTKREVELLQQWIAEGAAWEQHWAFLPVAARPVPAVKQAGWVKNPIDAFILARLETQGLAPAVAASKAVLLRRAYFDLIGLPPTPEEVDAFLADDRPTAYAEVIDRLLASERYGERWARHWLDVVRFAETNSFERDGPKPNAWRFRDYVIQSFNQDKPFDQFIREQLAGDEMPQATPEQLIATGYYRLGLWDDEPADRLLARFDGLDDLVTTTAQGFMGLTVNCARCHDHKIDPILQTDYYQLLSFFHDIQHYNPGSQTDISSPELAARWAEHDRQLQELRGKMEVIEKQGIVKMSAEDQRKSEGREREKLLKQKLKDFLDENQWQEYSKLHVAFEKVKNEPIPPRESALTIKTVKSPPDTFVMLRGNPHVPGQKVTPGFPALFHQPEPKIPTLPDNVQSSGRRTALAQWIASAENPLTARVMMNRVWQHHFGRGIVRSPNNFGLLGDPPTHPELLDWLAGEFTRTGWHLKTMHRLIMLSNAYQMSSQASPEGLARDPANNLFWRFDMRRLSAEELRDTTYAVTGKLNLKMYGPGIYPEISREVLQGQSQPGNGWGKSSPEEQARRSIYIHVKRSLITPLLSAFDFPETDGSCEARFVTTIPAQALAMFNGDFLHQQSASFADRLRREAGTELANQIKLALRLALCRPVTEDQVQRNVKLLEKLQTQHQVPADKALEYFCLITLNLNEFIYLD